MATNITTIKLENAKNCFKYLKAKGLLREWPECIPSTVANDTFIMKKIHAYIKTYFKVNVGKITWGKNNLYAQMILIAYGKNGGDFNRIWEWEALLEKRVIIILWTNTFLHEHPIANAVYKDLGSFFWSHRYVFRWLD